MVQNNNKSLKILSIKNKFNAIYDFFTKRQMIEKCNSDSERIIIDKMIPKIWNMDTQILKILNMFFQKITDVNVSSASNYSLEIECSNKGTYKLLFNDINVTPSSSPNKEWVAINTMLQYVRVLSFFKVIIIKDYKELQSSIKKEATSRYANGILLSNEFKQICLSGSVNKWMTLGVIYDFILKGIKDYDKDIINMAFSFFVSLTYYLDKEKIIFNNDINDMWAPIQFVKKKNCKGIGINTEMNKFDIIKKILNETYIQLAIKTEELLKIEIVDEVIKKYNSEDLWIFILDKFLDDLLFLLFDKKENEIEFNLNFEVYKEFKKVIDLNNEIEKTRQKLRENILKSRNKLNDKYYSDIESYSNDFQYLPDAIEQMEAAHILPVSDIKLKIKNNPNLKDKYLKLLSNENNGIIIDHVYHDAFDKNWLRLDYNGIFQPTDEWNKRYLLNGKVYKHGLVKIKEDVLSNEMKSFISWRK